MDQGASLGTTNMFLGQPVWSPEALQKRPTSKCFYRSPDSTVVLNSQFATARFSLVVERRPRTGEDPGSIPGAW